MVARGTAPCPHCRAENKAPRRECWRCKHTLPTTFSQKHAAGSSATVPGGHGADHTRAAAGEPLGDCVVLSRGDDEEALPYASGGYGRRLIWKLQRQTLLA
jgi:hypothetical protein